MTGMRHPTVRLPTDTGLTFLIILLRRFPHWAIWLPQQGQWVPARTRYGNRPTPHGSLIWVQARSARQLCERLQRAERELRDEAIAEVRQASGMSKRS